MLSQRLGETIFYPSRSETTLLTKEPARKPRSITDIGRNKRVADVELRKYGMADSLDFILLGSKSGGHREARECSRICELKKSVGKPGFIYWLNAVKVST